MKERRYEISYEITDNVTNEVTPKNLSLTGNGMLMAIMFFTEFLSQRKFDENLNADEKKELNLIKNRWDALLQKCQEIANESDS